MILPGQAKFYSVLFISFALAALQNVTIDDAVLTGPVVPQYLPTDSAWNIGNTCTSCLVQPDPRRTYNGTWHDSTYSPSNGFTQGIEFTFTGSGLYIFFIIANNVTFATTFTNVEFMLDQAPVSTYIHNPSASTDYQYDVPVYANNSLVLGTHTMVIQPINSGNNVLMLFDYLTYTTDTSSSVSSLTSAVLTTLSPSPTTSAASTGTSSKPNIGGIVGGTVGGVAALVLLAASLLCYRRHKNRNDDRPSAEESAVVDPFLLSHQVDPGPLAGTPSSTNPRTGMGFSAAEPTIRSKLGTSFSAQQPLAPPASATPSSSSGAAQSRNNPALLEQVELLRNEVARLRDLHDSDLNSAQLQTEAPPDYSSAVL